MPADEPREYKLVEVATVTDEELEKVINRFVGEGWSFEGIQFAMRESSRRPAMAFVTFTRRRGSASGAPDSASFEGPAVPSAGKAG